MDDWPEYHETIALGLQSNGPGRATGQLGPMER